MNVTKGPALSAVPEVVRHILSARGFKSEDEQAAYLFPSYETSLHDPMLMLEMDKAVGRIIEAIEKNQDIVVYGDYDIDGITASAVLLEAFAAIGGRARSYIPDRFEEGYGINLDALKALKEQGADLVVTVDCGITSVSEIAWANENGLDVVITDHHAVPEEIPAAIAVVNPKRPNDPYPFKDLAGVGVAFKLVQALQIATGKPAAGQEKWLLDLVALGTVCDVVTLVDENRTLAKYGLMVMAKTRRVGIQALAEVSGVELAKVRSYHLGFVFGPRMNAAGRLEHASRSLTLMMTDDAVEAGEIASDLDRLNRERQTEQATIFAAADEMAENYRNDPVLVLANPDWSHGIVGIVASKMVEKWKKPVVVMQILGETTKGSARSLGQFNIVEAFRAVSQHFLKFGGHHYAAGATIKSEDLEAFRADLVAYAKDHSSELEYKAEQRFDLELADTMGIDLELVEAVSQMEPFGAGNPQPILRWPQLTVSQARIIGKDRRHLKLTFKDAKGRHVEAICFGGAETCPNLKEGQSVEVYAHASANEFNGRTTLQLMVTKINE